MNQPTEFAPEYSLKEKLRIVLGSMVVGGGVCFGIKQYFFSWLTAFAASDPCETVLGLNAAQVLWYGIFVGLPAVFALLTASFGIWQGARVLRDGQSPPIGQKVLRPTRIRVGAKAKMVGWFQILSFVPFALIGLWGCGPAAEMSAQALMSKECAAKR